MGGPDDGGGAGTGDHGTGSGSNTTGVEPNSSLSNSLIARALAYSSSAIPGTGFAGTPRENCCDNGAAGNVGGGGSEPNSLSISLMRTLLRCRSTGPGIPCFTAKLWDGGGRNGTYECSEPGEPGSCEWDGSPEAAACGWWWCGIKVGSCALLEMVRSETGPLVCCSDVESLGPEEPDLADADKLDL